MPSPRLHYHALCAIAMFAVVPPAAEAQHSIRRLDGTRITVARADSLARHALEAAHVTGAQLAVMDRGQLVWSAAYGLRQRQPDLPMARTTTTWAASITKSVFSAYVMQLVERREFEVDMPIVAQLSKPLNEYEPYRETAVDIVRDSMWPSVTPRMLLAHTSGLANFAWLEPDKKLHLHTRPGTHFRYSGEGLNLVQFVIEQRTHRPLEELMQEAILAPLGMTRTSLVHRPELEADVADRFDAEGAFIAKTRRNPARAAGSMVSSAEDLARFASALLADRIIRPATRAAMLRPYVHIRSLHQFPLAADESDGVEAEKVGLAYGMGWGLLTKTPYGPAFFKEGHGDGAQNYMICFERSQQCMILLTNSDNGELAFRTLLEGILGDTVTPWEWEGYTPEFIRESRRQK